MVFCQLGLGIGIVKLGFDPFGLTSSVDFLVEHFPRVSGIPSHLVARNLSLALGSFCLFWVAALSRNKLFMVLEGNLTPMALLYLVAMSTALSVSVRILIAVVTFAILVRLQLLIKPTWSELRHRQLSDNWFGSLGIEGLNLGHITGDSIWHTVGGALLVYYSWLGWRAPQSTTESAVQYRLRRGISAFWVALNMPFTALAIIEAILQHRSLF
jgi:hypothetical protein